MATTHASADAQIRAATESALVKMLMIVKGSLAMKKMNYNEISDKGHSKRGQTKKTLVLLYTLYKITSERGQPLHKGQNAGS